MKKSVLVEKSFEFSKRIVKMYMCVSKEKKEFVFSKQCLRSGTAIGALIREGYYAQSRPDFISKMSLALKEANETSYWLDLLEATGFIDRRSYDSISNDNEELIKMLTSSVKTAKTKLPN